MSAPTIRFSAGPIQVSVWDNQGKDGKPYRTFKFQKSYKDAQGNWQHGDSFFAGDLSTIASLANAVFAEVGVREQKIESSPGPTEPVPY